MRRLVFLLVMLVVGATSIGCGPAGLSEDAVRSIVKEEVARQLDSIDELSVSKLTIRNEDGKDVVVITSFANSGNGFILIQDPNGMGRVLLSERNDGDGELSVLNRNDETIASLETSSTGEGVLIIGNKEKGRGAYLFDTTEGGLLQLNDSYGEIAALMGIRYGKGVIILHDEYGQITFGAP